MPADSRQRFVIDQTAAYVLRDGPDFEQVRILSISLSHTHVKGPFVVYFLHRPQ